MTEKVVLAVAALGLMLAMGSSARADTASFALTTTEGGTATPTADLVLVTIQTDVTNADCPSSPCVSVSFTPDTAAGATITTIDAPVYLNVNGDFSCYSNDGGACTPAGGGNTFGQMSLGTAAVSLSDLIVYLNPAGGNTNWSATTNDSADVLTPTCPGNDSKPTCVGGYGVSNPDTSGGYNTSDYTHGFEAEVEGGTQVGGEYVALATPEPASLTLVLPFALVIIWGLRRNLWVTGRVDR